MPAPRRRVDAEASQEGRVRVPLEIADGTRFRGITTEVGKAVTDAVIREHDGCVSVAMRELGVSKDVWYRVRRDWATDDAAGPGTVAAPRSRSAEAEPS